MGYSAHWDTGGSYVYLHPAKTQKDGRFKRDPVWLWMAERGEDKDIYKPIEGQAWTIKTKFGRDIRWYKHEEKKYWPDGFPDTAQSATHSMTTVTPAWQSRPQSGEKLQPTP